LKTTKERETFQFTSTSYTNIEVTTMKNLKGYFYVAGIMADGTGKKTTFLSDTGTINSKIDLSTG
jgi:hypothetical protein